MCEPASDQGQQSVIPCGCDLVKVWEDPFKTRLGKHHGKDFGTLGRHPIAPGIVPSTESSSLGDELVKHSAPGLAMSLRRMRPPDGRLEMVTVLHGKGDQRMQYVMQFI